MKRINFAAKITLFLAALVLFSGAHGEAFTQAASRPATATQWNAFVEGVINSYLSVIRNGKVGTFTQYCPECGYPFVSPDNPR